MPATSDDNWSVTDILAAFKDTYDAEDAGLMGRGFLLGQFSVMGTAAGGLELPEAPLSDEQRTALGQVDDLLDVSVERWHWRHPGSRPEVGDAD